MTTAVVFVVMQTSNALHVPHVMVSSLDAVIPAPVQQPFALHWTAPRQNPTKQSPHKKSASYAESFTASLNSYLQISGCGGSLCTAERMYGICEYRPEDECYQLHGTCGHFGPQGECDWKPSRRLQRCIESRQIQ